ncbi:Multidrug resistance-associated protein 1 [Globomyces sp. JEL0801]|nr:Multidrug resistance-associated protein 1 [Globomyces sp. JEL0801]
MGWMTVQMSRSTSPELHASFISRIFFVWVWPFMNRGWKKPLEIEDVYDLNPEMTSEHLDAVFTKAWEQEEMAIGKRGDTFIGRALLVLVKVFRIVKSIGNMPAKMFKKTTEEEEVNQEYVDYTTSNSIFLVKVLLRAFGTEYLAAGILRLIMIGMGFLSPQLMNLLLVFLQSPRQENQNASNVFGLSIIFSLVLINFINVGLSSMFTWICDMVTYKARSALMTTLYKKALRMRVPMDAGEITNRFSGDTAAVTGIASFASLATTIIIGSATYFVTPIIIRRTVLMMELNDKRIGLVSGSFGFIQTIKMYGWENVFGNKITSVRNTQLKELGGVMLINAFVGGLIASAVNLIILSTLALYALTAPKDQPLDLAKIFVGMALLNTLQGPLNTLAGFYAEIMQLSVSFERLTDVLLAPMIDHQHEYRPVDEEWNSFVSIRKANFGTIPEYEDEEPILILHDINVDIPIGKLTLILGPTGSGKTSLLEALADSGLEIQPGSQIMKVPDFKSALLTQEPWIFNGTIRDNILFFSEYDADWYKSVVEACSLVSDFELMKGRDRAELNDGGNLSGGQKNRIALARVVYTQSSDVFFFDDPLSAVDAKVGAHIFQNVMSNEGILASKTRIMVTNRVDLISKADHIVVMDQGTVIAQGSYSKIMESDDHNLKVILGLAKDRNSVQSSFSIQSETFKVEPSTVGRVLSAIGEEAEPDTFVFDEDDFMYPLDDYIEDYRNGTVNRQAGTIGRGETIKRNVTLNRSNTLKRSGTLGRSNTINKSGTLGRSNTIRKNTLGRSNTLKKSTSGTLGRTNTLKKSTDTLTRRDGPNVESTLTRSNTIVTLSRKRTLGANIMITDEEQDELNIKEGQKYNVVKDEMGQRGKLNYNLYGYYLKNTSRLVTFIVFVLLLFNLGVESFDEFWLQIWGQANSSLFITNLYFLLIFFFGSVGNTAFDIILNIVAIRIMALQASRKMHETSIKTTLASPMSFFHANPAGRIINRFSNDMTALDRTIPSDLMAMINALLAALMSILLASIASYYVIIIALVMGVLYFFLISYFMATVRELRRLVLSTQSPTFTFLKDTLDGLATIRGCHKEMESERKIQKLINQNSKVFYSTFAASSWLATNIQFLSFLLTIPVMVFVVIQKDTANAGFLAIALTNALSVGSTLQGIIQAYIAIEISMVSIERIKEYIELKSEDEIRNTHLKTYRPPKKWPMKGEIQFIDYSTSYTQDQDDREDVLKHLDLTFKAGNRIAIVGRTGAGKSSIVLALFQLLRPTTGKILIDGVDLAKLNIQTVRERLAIIPQEAMVFPGTIRDNLDPAHKYKDEDLWESLELVGLKDLVMGLNEKTEKGVSKLEERFPGERLSVGQKQQFCLCRAILVKSKVVVLDEPTANIDIQTDEIIQKLIRDVFKSCTIITIAHRIPTILDYDKVLVLDQGKVVEFDDPKVLLADPESSFYSLANA